MIALIFTFYQSEQMFYYYPLVAALSFITLILVNDPYIEINDFGNYKNTIKFSLKII